MASPSIQMDVGGGELGAGAGEHLGGEVEADDGLGSWAVAGRRARRAAVMSPVPQQRSRTRASGRCEDGREGAGGAAPPAAVEAEGEQVVEAVVGGGDGVEDLRTLAAAAASSGSLAGRAPGCDAWSMLIGWRPCGCRVHASPVRRRSRSSASVTSRTTVASPMPTGRTKERVPLRFFLSLAVSATSVCGVGV